MGWVYSSIIKPRYRKAITGKETPLELRIDEVSYNAFKSRCLDLAAIFEEHLLVLSVVTFVLQAMLHIGDTNSTDEVKDNVHRMIEVTRRKGRLEDETEEDFKRMLTWLQETYDTAEERAAENYRLYEYFCENVVRELLLERIQFT